MDNIVKLNEYNIANVSSIDFPHSGIAYKTLNQVKENLQVVVAADNNVDSEFDIIGIDPSIANALRRIMISEVPTVTIEQVYVHDNTTIMSDNILAQRLGLVPIKADPREFEFRAHNEAPTDMNTLVFSFQVECKRNPDANADAIEPSEKYINSTAYSGDILWVPQGDQEDRFKDDPIKPLFDDIVIAKLKPGQVIHAELHCQKGIGKEHAKWSPCVASYRLMPRIILKEPIRGEEAKLLQKCFPKGCIEIKNDEAVVVNERKDTGSREVYCHDSIKHKVQLGRQKDHFLFFIESQSALSPKDIVETSVQILAGKCQIVRNALNELGLTSTLMEQQECSPQNFNGK